MKKTGTLGEILAQVSKETGVGVAVSAEAASRKVKVDFRKVAGGEAVQIASQMAGAYAREVQGGLAYGVATGQVADPDVKAQPVVGGAETSKTIKLSLSGAPMTIAAAKLGEAGKAPVSADPKLEAKTINASFKNVPFGHALAAVAEAAGATVKSGGNGYTFKKR